MDTFTGDPWGIGGGRGRALVAFLEGMPSAIKTLHIRLTVTGTSDIDTSNDLRAVDWAAIGRRLARAANLERVSITLHSAFDIFGYTPSWPQEYRELITECIGASMTTISA